MSDTVAPERAAAAEPVALSASFLLAVRREDPTAELAATLADLDSETLATRLDTDGARIAFWVNIYNATTQRALAEDPSRYESRRQFFSSPLVTVAGRSLSLNNIENGILRRSHSMLTMGYIRTPGPLRDGFIETHAPDKRDPRIHFALNCAADSCPPIAAYTRADIDSQLDLATQGYLDEHVTYDPNARGRFGGLRGSGRALVPRVMLWFRGDFGGHHGIVELLRRYEQIPSDADPRLSYRGWDWSLDLADYTETADADDTYDSR